MPKIHHAESAHGLKKQYYTCGVEGIVHSAHMTQHVTCVKCLQALISKAYVTITDQREVIDILKDMEKHTTSQLEEVISSHAKVSERLEDQKERLDSTIAECDDFMRRDLASLQRATIGPQAAQFAEANEHWASGPDELAGAALEAAYIKGKKFEQDRLSILLGLGK